MALRVRHHTGYRLGNEFQIDGIDDEEEFTFSAKGHSEKDDKFDEVVGTL